MNMRLAKKWRKTLMKILENGNDDENMHENLKRNDTAKTMKHLAK